jgi:hypothetical protein
MPSVVWVILFAIMVIVCAGVRINAWAAAF